MELADVEVMKSPKAAIRRDPPIEVAMKELVDNYRPVRQRTVQSETTKTKAELSHQQCITLNLLIPK